MIFFLTTYMLLQQVCELKTMYGVILRYKSENLSELAMSIQECGGGDTTVDALQKFSNAVLGDSLKNPTLVWIILVVISQFLGLRIWVRKVKGGSQ